MIEVYCKEIDGEWFGTACRNREVVATWFAESRENTLKGLLSELPFTEPFQVSKTPSDLAGEIVTTLAKVYAGEGVAKHFPLDLSGLAAYSRKVIEATLRVPVGYVTTYGSIAEAIGGGPRAVGNVMASNRFAPLVPCHRVVKSDFTLGGYGGGLRTKVEMPRREERGYSEPIQVSVEGGSLLVFPVELVFKKLPKAIFG